MMPVLVFALAGCSAPVAKIPTISPSGSEFDAKVEPGSLWKTSDGGQTFQVKSQVDETTRISVADILSITYNSKRPAAISVSTVDHGIFKTVDGGERWEHILFPPKRIYSFILDRNDPDNRMFASGVVGEWAKIFRSDDGGEHWREVYTEPGPKTVVTALAQHPRDTNVIFAGTSVGTVVKSTDGGATWRNVGNKVDGTSADFAFDATKPLETYLLMYGEKIYVSSDGGVQWSDWESKKAEEVQSLKDKAKTFAKTNPKESARLQAKAQDLIERNQKNRAPSGIVSIATDPAVSGVIYAGTTAGLFRSDDYGKYWTEINIIESAKTYPVRSIAVNPTNSKEIVFVAGKAFNKSTDGGETWATVGLNVDRGTSFVSYDPFDPKYMFIGLRNFAPKK